MKQLGDTLTTDVDTSRDETRQAQKWWNIREIEVERDLTASLQRRMETQRAQLYAFKTEQSKWEHELQLRISKYAYDRKLLSEHNVELKEKILIMEEKLNQYEREMDYQVHHVIELEGMVQENQINGQQIQALQQENDELHWKLGQWERFYQEEKKMMAKKHTMQQEELLMELEKLLDISKHKLMELQHDGAFCRDQSTKDEHVRQARVRPTNPKTDDSLLVMRIKELEATCKQKDQTVYSLKTIVEQQETAFDEKVKILTAKYDQVKTINMALQKRLIHALTEASSKS
ncbi:unnamed protein product [Peronospora belbahrii]|uniref:Uncharacterized protein n=1 Tax=Peronospora belbahrii TaxID=622444 RepID=A0AAU9LCL1_9STRA|nr:unnamed protein product [Peronospora belbahrii]